MYLDPEFLQQGDPLRKEIILQVGDISHTHCLSRTLAASMTSALAAIIAYAKGHLRGNDLTDTVHSPTLSRLLFRLRHGRLFFRLLSRAPLRHVCRCRSSLRGDLCGYRS